ncbi:class I SAM-dependent methyltransferase [Acetobacter fallax]|uniref:Class I SAM-dependent methyltransferase n=1 Tax=Acetobacter fallax TaxID=1737473 RepID=A0ABX0KAY0_9PROT|nr:class I SAM-dependent methyltransferase [Acetobacter fallax]NHO33559.1 hypothetical protein [Acetobacter fallax]NHO36528.1 hypothetical protein [Acetobacter fallax]
MSGTRPVKHLPDFLLRNARILSDRTKILPLLPKGGHIAEVGVMAGEFSRTMIEVCRPERFYGIDLFLIHEMPQVWGRPTSEMFKGQTHQAFYEARFAREIARGQVQVLAGDSKTMLERIPDYSLDVVYLDADHTYPSVIAELEVCSRKLRPVTGLIVLNDYIMRDDAGPYGVIQAAHDFMMSHGWEMVAFALEENMYCDVVLRKLPASRCRRIARRLPLAAGYHKLGRF